MDLCRGKDVLHLGFIQHSHLYEKLIAEGKWLHGQLRSVAKRLAGIDYLASDVEAISAKYGYECYAGDAMRLEGVPLRDTFDVILCGELIEHIENPGLMLDGIKRFMHADSVLAITTPNPWCTQRIDLVNRGILEDRWLNNEHVCWYTYGTLKQLLQRKGFEEVDYGYYFHQSSESVYSTPGRFLKSLRIAKKAYFASRVKPQNYEGLFFVSRLRSNA
ncbi:MAG: methyltransferase domain-containing protein [Fibrobacteres bacterium]|nr:methyltransferase domain-containing protein [Fibrobacterota bacterium]